MELPYHLHPTDLRGGGGSLECTRVILGQEVKGFHSFLKEMIQFGDEREFEIEKRRKEYIHLKKRKVTLVRLTSSG